MVLGWQNHNVRYTPNTQKRSHREQATSPDGGGLMDRVNIRMPRQHLDELEHLGESGGYASRSEVLREAYREWRERNLRRIAEAERRGGVESESATTPHDAATADVAKVRELREESRAGAARWGRRATNGE